MPTPANRIVDEVLGELVAGPQQRPESQWRQWSGSVMRGEHEIRLGLGGDAAAPRPWLLAELRNIVQHLEEIVERAGSALAECAPQFDIADFRIASVSEWDEADTIFEITFEPLDSMERANVETTWPAATVVCHRVVIARDYRAVRCGDAVKLPTPKVPADFPGPRPG